MTAVAPDSLILTSKGYKPASTLKIGDQVMTHKGVLKPLTACTSQESKIGSLHYMGRNAVFCSPDSHILCSQRRLINVKGKYYDQIDSVRQMVSEPFVANVQTPDVDWLCLSRLRQSKALPKSSYIESGNESFLLYLLGVFYRYGSYGRNKRGFYIHLSFCSERTVRLVQEHYSPTVYDIVPQTKSCNIRIYDQKLYTFAKSHVFVWDNRNRSLPVWVYSCLDRQEFIDGIFSFHQTSDEGVYRTTSADPCLALGIADLLATKNIVASVRYLYQADSIAHDNREQADGAFLIRSWDNSKAYVVGNYMARPVRQFITLDKVEPLVSIDNENHSFVCNSLIMVNQ